MDKAPWNRNNEWLNIFQNNVYEDDAHDHE